MAAQTLLKKRRKGKRAKLRRLVKSILACPRLFRFGVVSIQRVQICEKTYLRSEEAGNAAGSMFFCRLRCERSACFHPPILLS